MRTYILQVYAETVEKPKKARFSDFYRDCQEDVPIDLSCHSEA